MRLNAHGQACHGLLTLCTDGQVVTQGLRSTAPDWLLEDTAIFQTEDPVGSDHWFLQSCQVATGQRRFVDPDPATTVYASGTGVWAAWRTSGVRSNLHPTMPGAGLWGVGHDGCLGYCQSQQQGTGIIFRSTVGTASTVLQNVPLHDVHIVAYGVAAGVSKGHLRTVGAPEAVTVDEEVFGPRLVQLRKTGEWWVLYHTQTRLLLQPLVKPVGYVVAPVGSPTYGSDLVELPSGLLRVVWSRTPGEGAGAYMVRDIDRESPRVALVPIAPEPPPDPERPRVTMTYSPRFGASPLTVTAVRVLSGGPATTLYWRQRLRGEATWTRVATNPASDPDHHYHFTTAGVYELGVDVLGPGGSDSTGTPRLVEVT